MDKEGFKRKGNDLSERFLTYSVEIIKIGNALPKSSAGKHIGGQLLKSGTSSGSNYEEACGAESRADFVHKLGIVLKELKESRYWLKVIQFAKLLNIQCVEHIIQESEQLCAIIARSILTAKKSK